MSPSRRSCLGKIVADFRGNAGKVSLATMGEKRRNIIGKRRASQPGNTVVTDSTRLVLDDKWGKKPPRGTLYCGPLRW